MSHTEFHLLPWSDGLTIPLLAKRAIRAGGRGILLQKGGLTRDKNQDSKQVG